VLDSRYHQVAGLHLLLGLYADATPRRVAYQLRVLVPQHVRVGSWSLGCDARQIDVAATLDEQLAVGQDLSLGGCQRAASFSINGYVNKLPIGWIHSPQPLNFSIPIPMPHPSLSCDVLGCLIN